MVTATPVPNVPIVSTQFAITDAIALIALGISLVDLFLHAFGFWRERTGLRITQMFSEPAYSLGFIWYREYKCAFFKLQVENKTKTPVTISHIMLKDKKGNKFEPAPFAQGDPYNDNGISIWDRSNQREYIAVDLRTENLLDSLRIIDHGCNTGYLVFYDVPIVENEKEEFTLHINTPTKRYKKKIIIERLPDNLKPYYEVKPKAQAQSEASQ